MTSTHHAATHTKHRATVDAAATAHVDSDPHAADPTPDVQDLSTAQKTLLSTLHFLTAYEIKHLHKASPDVVHAFDATTLATIEANPTLGGKAKADRVRALQAQHVQLAEIANIVAPIARLVGQNLLVADSQLAIAVGESLKAARAYAHSNPALAEGLAALESWSALHHGGGAHASAPAPTTPTAPAAKV
jgi:hypothetical protein